MRAAGPASLTKPAVQLGTMGMNLETSADEIYAWNTFAFPFNSTGQPAISLPHGFSNSGLPLAFQIVGRPFDESGIIALAAQFEEAHPWKERHPPID